MLPIDVSDCFHTIAMDIVGPMKPAKGGEQYILVMIDYATRYADAVALKTTTSDMIVKALIERIFLKFGTPAKIISDRSVQFTSKPTKDILKKL